MNQIELKSIETAIRETKSKLRYTHYQVIYLHLQGYKTVELPLTAQTIGKHIRNYKKDGLNRLIITGCPKKLSNEQEALFIETVTHQTPTDVKSEPLK